MTALSTHIRQLVSIPERRLSSILESFSPQVFPKKAHILQARQSVGEVYFLQKGCVRTYIYDLSGAEHNITFSMENWWFGDLQAFINETPASFYIQALEDTTVLSIQKSNWDQLLLDHPEFVAYTRILFRNTMFAHENRILQNLSFTAEERYRQFLQQYPELSQRIPQKQIASYLGITPEFLSMIRSKVKS